MLKINYKSETNRKIKIIRPPDSTHSISILVTIFQLEVEFRFTVEEAEKYFEKGLELCREIRSGKAPTIKRSRWDSRSVINPKSQL